ncbi:hypothetical protein [Streptacidiphilus sp. MAP5-3]|uniref:hypothetical protein n=1 Tax=unclassified Streptacidiphilus TaxID=2643834 RepID=UPI003518D443
MALQFIDFDENSGANNSPTIWVEDTTGDLVVQSYELTPETLADVHKNPAPGHQPGVPAGELVIRIPARMRDAIRKACDVADSL